MASGSAMNEANAEYLDPDLLKDAEATNQRPALSSDGDELKTTRLPPLSPPPPAVSSMPPLPSFPPPAMTPTFTLNEGPPRHEAEPASKPSWLRALLTSTFPPPSPERAAGAKAPVSTTAAGTIFAVLGLVFAAVSLVTGLKGAPSDPTVAPIVSAALVIARALVALGAGALCFGMFRQAERLLVKP
jgi:hypothetical protein